MMRMSTKKAGNYTTEDGRVAQILCARGAFIYLPITQHNDLVAGSWYFVAGSALQTVAAIIPLVDLFSVELGRHVFSVPPDTGLKAFDDIGCWILLIISGSFFTIGSYIFVRAFKAPPPPPMFTWHHCATDELAASWMYFFATFPAIPYSLVWLHANKGTSRYQYWGAFFASCAFVAGSAFFVYTCYPSQEEQGPPPKPHILRLVQRCLGANTSLAPHLKTDWLAACWFFFWSSAFWFMGSWLLLFSAQTDRQLFTWLVSAADAFLYTVGSAYYVAGSYPPEGADLNYDDPANHPPAMKKAHADAEDRRTDVVYVDKEDTHNVLHSQAPSAPQKMPEYDAAVPPVNPHHPLFNAHRNEPGYNPFRPPTPTPPPEAQ